jgi:hypothetical protein
MVVVLCLGRIFSTRWYCVTSFVGGLLMVLRKIILLTNQDPTSTNRNDTSKTAPASYIVNHIVNQCNRILKYNMN